MREQLKAVRNNRQRIIRKVTISSTHHHVSQINNLIGNIVDFHKIAIRILERIGKNFVDYQIVGERTGWQTESEESAARCSIANAVTHYAIQRKGVNHSGEKRFRQGQLHHTKLGSD